MLVPLFLSASRTLYVLTAVVFLALWWSYVTPIDISVKARGIVRPEGDPIRVIAETGGRIVGSNCLDERSVIAGIGPITIDPSAQNVGIGRKLMQAVMNRANGAPRRWNAARTGRIPQSLALALH